MHQFFEKFRHLSCDECVYMCVCMLCGCVCGCGDCTKNVLSITSFREISFVTQMTSVLVLMCV